MNHEDIPRAFKNLGIPVNHTTVGLSNLVASSSQFKSLFANRRLPDNGLTDVQIQTLLFSLSSLDTNNAAQSRRCGVGEREGRLYSSLVMNRHFGFSHGIGRSGDITEPQPKAVGSSALARLTLHLALDAIRRGSLLDKQTSARTGIILPLCTGMSIALVLQSLQQQQLSAKEVVLWCRIDQKSCFKAILSAGLRCEVIPTSRVKDAVMTDLEALEEAIRRVGTDCILAVITTTSCFAPRVPDRVDEVAKICKREGISHLINNAYGLQCEQICKLLNRACAVGRVDAIVSSTDKNFMVPVGGAIVLSPKGEVIKNIGQVYAGRASAAPCIDLFITLLSMGLNGYKGILSDRQLLINGFKKRLAEVAERHGERLMSCPGNTISFGVTLNTLGVSAKEGESDDERIKRDGLEISYFGSMLFTRCVSGTRVVPRCQKKEIGGQVFIGYGSSTDAYGDSYLTAACAIGVTQGELDEFFLRLEKAFKDFFAKRRRGK